jgi:hypothetical protein
MKNKNHLVLFAIASFTVFALATMTLSALHATTTTVQATVIASSSSISNVTVNGQNTTPVDTYNSNNVVSFDVRGDGVITITDQHGNVLFVYNKPTGGVETITANIDLQGGVGEHNLTISISGSGGFADSSFTINFLPVPLPPTTGINVDSYSYVGGFAVNNLDILMLTTILACISIFVFLIVHRDKSRKQHKVAGAKFKQSTPKTIRTKSTKK